MPKSASLLLAFLPDELIDRVEAGYTQAIERTWPPPEAGTQRDELIAEQQLRDAMPQSQRIAEGFRRIEVHQQQTARALEQLAAQPDLEPDVAAPGVDLELDYHARTIDCGLDIDPGDPSLGL